MNKKSIDGLINKLNDIEREIPSIKRNLEYIKKFNLAEYPKRDWVDAKESLQEAELDILMFFIEINKKSEEIIKKIDAESWKEYRDSK